MAAEIRLDDDGRCVCCGLEPASCGKAVEALQWRQVMLDRQAMVRRGAFPAAYGGTCSKCGERFAEKTLIRRDPDGDRSAYLGECCA